MAFRLGSTSRLDERCFSMQQLKVMPLSLVMLSIYPKMYPIHELSDEVHWALLISELFLATYLLFLDITRQIKVAKWRL